MSRRRGVAADITEGAEPLAEIGGQRCGGRRLGDAAFLVEERRERPSQGRGPRRCSAARWRCSCGIRRRSKSSGSVPARISTILAAGSQSLHPKCRSGTRDSRTGADRGSERPASSAAASCCPRAETPRNGHAQKIESRRQSTSTSPTLASIRPPPTIPGRADQRHRERRLVDKTVERLLMVAKPLAGSDATASSVCDWSPRRSSASSSWPTSASVYATSPSYGRSR